MDYLIALGLLVAGLLILPLSVRSMKKQRQGRVGWIAQSLADAIDPRRAKIVAENENAALRKSEKEREDDEPLD